MNRCELVDTLDDHVSAFREPHRPGVLIADASDLVLKVLSVGLRQHGFDVWQAANGMEALETYARRREQIVLALVDVHLPELEGPATLNCLRRLNPELPVCLLSTGEDDEVALRATGATHVFQKPVRFAELSRTLKMLLGEAPGKYLCTA